MADAYVTQVFVETAGEASSTDLRLSQLHFEYLYPAATEVVWTQVYLEPLMPRISQFYDCGVPAGAPEDLCDKRLVYAYLEWDVTAGTTLTYES